MPREQRVSVQWEVIRGVLPVTWTIRLFSMGHTPQHLWLDTDTKLGKGISYCFKV